MENPNNSPEDSREGGPPTNEELEAEKTLELIRQFQWGEIEIEGVIETTNFEENRFVAFAELQQLNGVHWFAAKDTIFSRNVFVRDTEKNNSALRGPWDHYIQIYRKLIFNGHANLSSVFEIRDGTVDRSGSGIRLITEWIDGDPLSSILQKHHRLPPFEIAKLSLQIASALRFLHDRHCYHHRFDPADIYRDRTGKFVLVRYGEAPTDAANQPLEAALDDVNNSIKLILTIVHAQTPELSNTILQFQNGTQSITPARDLEAALRSCFELNSKKYLNPQNPLLTIAARPFSVFKTLFSNKNEKKP